jgi:calcineurin-like phosphoesterase family protein
MKKTLFTSDTHFGHRNMTNEGKNYSNRPFDTIVQMDETLIANWNAAVDQDDDIYHLGDFAMGKTPAPQILSRLNGRKHLIWGNHDSNQVRQLPEWTSSQPYLEINLDGQFIVLCHYSMRVWNKSHRGAIMLYGHSHGSLPGTDQSCDVGVDNMGLKPVTLEEIRRYLRKQPSYLSVDHHKVREK